jgi:hypothetical protein
MTTGGGFGPRRHLRIRITGQEKSPPESGGLFL